MLTLLMTCLSPASAASDPTKEEVVYAPLDADGRSGEVYVVNIFPGGVVTDYGDYTSVRMMNTEDAVSYGNGLVSFVGADSRVYYQGNMARAELPWLLEVTWNLNGQPMEAAQMAGASGAMELHLTTRRNPACDGAFFDTHVLQITASLDTEKCRNITCEGATQANVGSMRQLSWIVLPGTEADITLTADVADFEMPALSMAGVRMQLDPGEEVIADVLELADGLEELSSHNEELTDGATQLVQAAFDTANAELQASRADFERLGITLNDLTMENYDEEITRLQNELLDKVDDYVLRQADAQLRAQVNRAAEEMVRTEVEKAAREQVEQEVRKAAAQQIREAVTAEARKQVEEAVRNPTGENIDALVEAQMQTDEVQAMIDANVAAHSVLPTLPPLFSPPTENDTTTFTDLFSLLIRSASAEEGTTPDRIEAEVASRMASQEVQQQIDALTEAAMVSDTTQALINAQVTSSMQSHEVQALIDAQVAAQVADPDNRAQAKAVAREEVRRQVEAVAREQVRAAIVARLSTMRDDEVDALVEQQMQSASVQQMIEDEVAVQMTSAEVQAMIDAEVENQMASEAVQALIDEECAKQMASDEVQRQISSEMETYRNSAAYLNQVSDALEANGENGEAYQALVTLRETLDDVMRFYDGLIEYTDGVGEAAEGVSSAREEVRAMLGDEDGQPRETLSFASEKNGAVKSVQFVFATPAIEKDDEPAAEQDEPADGTLVDKLLRLLR